MVLNVNEIIENKIRDLESNHVIEDAIQKIELDCSTADCEEILCNYLE